MPAAHVGFCVQPLISQVAQDGFGGAGIYDVEHPLAAFQTLAHEGRQHRPVFLFRLVEAAKVIPRLEVLHGV